MKATIHTKSGLNYGVSVRWSRQIGGLYTTESNLSDSTGGRITLANVMCASAPITVYRGEWNEFGFEEPKEFYGERNVAGRVPFCDMNWNCQYEK